MGATVETAKATELVSVLCYQQRLFGSIADLLKRFICANQIAFCIYAWGWTFERWFQTGPFFHWGWSNISILFLTTLCHHHKNTKYRHLHMDRQPPSLDQLHLYPASCHKGYQALNWRHLNIVGSHQPACLRWPQIYKKNSPKKYDDLFLPLKNTDK